jgi:hypothetical protein
LFKQALGTAVTPSMEQGKTQEIGAVKFVLAEQLIFAENVADTVQLAPLAVNPVIE